MAAAAAAASPRSLGASPVERAESKKNGKLQEIAERVSGLNTTCGYYKFIHSLPTEARVHTGMMVAGGAASGASIGMMAGVCSGPLFPIVAPAVGIPMAIVKGLAAHFLVKSSLASEFMAWRMKQEDSGVLSLLKKEVLGELEDQDSCLDPITEDIMTDPVMTPNGDVFEKATLEEILARTGEHPMTRKAMTIEDTVPAFPVMTKLIRAVQRRIEALAEDAPEELQEGLRALQSNLEANLKAAGEESTQQIMLALKAGKLKAAEAGRMLTNLGRDSEI